MTIPVTATPAPTGEQLQTITAEELGEATLAGLEVFGENVLWFASNSEAFNGQFPMALSTVLENENTYYAIQTIGGCTSVAPLAVTVSVALGLDNVYKPEWKVYPNPTKDFVTVSGNRSVKSVKVFSMLGQIISDKKILQSASKT